MMTVKELIKVLSKYDEDDIVSVHGSEGANGDWAYLLVSDDEEEAIWQDGTIILEMEQ